MLARSVRVVLFTAVLTAAVYAGARRVGPLPPLGAFLDPWSGVWSVAAAAEPRGEESATLSGLTAPVRVVFDDRGVPHLFATTSEDAARALGYVVARDRLFQMELRWRTSAGRVSELVGGEALELDRSLRRLGLAWSAERDYAALDPESQFGREVAAYAEGVNEWIADSGRRRKPLEYHLLGARPSPWKPAYSLYLLKLLGWDLTYPTAMDLQRLRLQAQVGLEAARSLLPVNSPIQQPIQPNGERRARYDFAAIAAPGEPDTTAQRLVHDLELALGPLAEKPPFVGDATVWGSNNWAVAPERAAAGHALLGGDPHLELTLPPVWYEAHMVAPGELDVYGVTIPSVPNIILGFNRDVAWSFTNTGADVIDYYQEALDHPERPTHYRLDGEWRPLERHVEEYRDPAGRLLATDTLYFTHRGPLLRHEGRSLSMRWTVLEGGGAAAPAALSRAARAGSVQEWLSATESFSAPAQNMIVADRAGIAIRSTGQFPEHPDGSGLVLRDGTSSASDWIGYWPVTRFPYSNGPQQGYLASANQQPIDPRVDSTYLGADWPPPWRAIRINDLLAADSAATPDAMRRYQTDPGNPRADMFVPFFLDAVRRKAKSEAADTAAGEAARLLAEWDRRYTRDNERAVLFEYAIDELIERTWDELLAPSAQDSTPRRVFTPSSAVLASLLHQPDNIWWDDRRTAERVEDRDAVLVASLAAAMERARREHGEPDSGGWRWEKVQHANIYHVLGRPALSALRLPVQGGPGNLNPSDGRGTHGASWRMVVELGPAVRAWTIYPGGQSGNPMSSRYADRIEKWSRGELDRALFPRTPDEIDSSRVIATLRLVPER